MNISDKEIYKPILDYLRTADLDTHEIKAITGLPIHIVKSRLNMLREHGVIEARGYSPKPVRGRPAFIWRLCLRFKGGEIPKRYTPEFRELKRDHYQHRDLAMILRR